MPAGSSAYGHQPHVKLRYYPCYDFVLDIGPFYLLNVLVNTQILSLILVTYRERYE